MSCNSPKFKTGETVETSSGFLVVVVGTHSQLSECGNNRYLISQSRSKSTLYKCISGKSLYSYTFFEEELKKYCINTDKGKSYLLKNFDELAIILNIVDIEKFKKILLNDE